MPNIRKPRAGSMQYWPRKRAKREYPRVKSWASIEEGAKNSGHKNPLLGFAGYKVGMTHIIVKDPRSKVLTSGMELSVPVTVVECPPLKIFSVRFYEEENNALKVAKEINNSVLDKELARKITTSKKKNDVKKSLETINVSDYKEIRILVYTQPSKVSGLNKKKPEIFEVGLQGSMDDKLNYIKENIDKEIALSDVFEAGQQIDIHAVTTGRGYQGPVKRFGIGLRAAKSEKSVRNPGSLGGWKGHGHFMYRIAHAGQTGYHTRLEHNKQVYLVEDDVSKIIPSGGFVNYGNVKSTYMLVKGSILGPKKRLIRFTAPVRPNKNMAPVMPIVEISLKSKQGN